MGVNISLKIIFLRSYLNFFSENLGGAMNLVKIPPRF